MNYSIDITEKAEKDIEDALNYIELSLMNQKAANNLLETIDKKVSSLSNSPARYHLAYDPILRSMGIRLLLINNYIAFYTIDESAKTVHIVRFLYEKRNWESILKSEIELLDGDE